MSDSPILELLEAAIENPVPPAESLRWIQEGLRAYVFEGIPLERALQLNTVHPHGCRQAYQKWRLRHHLRQAAATLPGTPWEQAKILAAALRELSRRPARPIRTEFDKHLHEIWAVSGGRMPRSEVRLYDILSDP